MAAGQVLDEHENPGEATVNVVSGRVTLSADAEPWEGSPGLSRPPPSWLTVAKPGCPGRCSGAVNCCVAGEAQRRHRGRPHHRAGQQGSDPWRMFQLILQRPHLDDAVVDRARRL